MKLNEKHLASFATGSAPTDKEGFLLKRGEVNKSFQKRWFVLKGNLLFYFERRQDKEPIGVIILEGCTVELSENSELYTFELVFQGLGTRTYVLAADSQEEMESWMKAVACAGYDYMKLLVAELQRQVDDVNIEQQRSNVPPVPPARRPKDRNSTNADRQSKENQNLLVDLSPSDSDQQQYASARVNPFNDLSRTSTELDAFGATPFSLEYDGGEGASRRPRTFKEMHRDFGVYIQKKMSEKDLLS